MSAIQTASINSQATECHFQSSDRCGDKSFSCYFIPLIQSRTSWGTLSGNTPCIQLKIILIDVTERKKKEELIKAKEVAEASNR